MDQRLTAYEKQCLSILTTKNRIDEKKLQNFLEGYFLSLSSVPDIECHLSHLNQNLVIKHQGVIQKEHSLKSISVTDSPIEQKRSIPPTLYISAESGQPLYQEVGEEILSGLFIQNHYACLGPFYREASFLGISTQFISSESPDPQRDVHDLFISPELDYLFVTQRVSGQLFLFELPTGKYLGQFKIRPEGSNLSMSVAIDTYQSKAYITDHQSDTLSILDLKSFEINLTNLSFGKLGQLAIDPLLNCLFIELLSSDDHLVYLDLNTLTRIKSFHFQGINRDADANSNCSSLQLSPDRKHLVYCTYDQFSLVNLIDLETAQWVESYRLSHKDQPQHIVFSQPNAAHSKESHLLDLLLKSTLITESTFLWVQEQLAEHQGKATLSDLAQEVSQDCDLSRDECSVQDDVNYLDLLKDISFLRSAGHELLARLKQRLRSRSLASGDILIREGDEGNALYFILEGQLEVLKGPKMARLACLQMGDTVGEMAILNHEKRNATVRALLPSKVLELQRHDFAEVMLEFPELSLEIKLLSEQRQSAMQEFNQLLKHSSLQRIRMLIAVESLERLSVFKGAPPGFFESLANRLNSLTIMAGKPICLEGDKAEHIYFIQMGKLDVHLNGSIVTTLGEGDLFGEMAWLLRQSRNASVISKTICKLLQLEFKDFDTVIRRYPGLKKRLAAMVEERQNELWLYSDD